MDKISQEMYCNECDGFFIVRLRIDLNISAEIICPNCEHRHYRHTENGAIFDGTGSGRKETIRPTRATYHKKPLTERIKRNNRNGSPMQTGEVQHHFNQRWLDVAAREAGED